MSSLIGTVAGIATTLVGLSAIIFNDKLVGAGLITAGIAILYHDEMVTNAQDNTRQSQ